MFTFETSTLCDRQRHLEVVQELVMCLLLWSSFLEECGYLHGDRKSTMTSTSTTKI